MGGCKNGDCNSDREVIQMMIRVMEKTSSFSALHNWTFKRIRRSRRLVPYLGCQ